MGVEDLPTVEDIHEIHELIAQQWDLSHRGTRAVLPDQTLQSVLDDVRDLDGGTVGRQRCFIASLMRTSTKTETNELPGQ